MANTAFNSAIKGDVGAQGTMGATGAQGPQGSTGSTGSQGPQGYQGAQGFQGSAGSTGSQGPQGYQGSTGADSTVAGPQGYQGAQGSQGPQGEPGPQGYQGYQGAQGNQGYQGATGTTLPAPRVQSVSDAATVTPNADSNDCVDITALAQAVTIANPSGTPVNFQKLLIRIKDNGTARAISFGTSYVAGGVTLPTTTVLSKILTLGFIYNTANSLNKWQLVASAQEA